MKRNRQHGPLLAVTALLLAGLCVGYAAADQSPVQVPDHSGSETVAMAGDGVQSSIHDLGMGYELRVCCPIDPELEAPTLGGPIVLREAYPEAVGTGTCTWEEYYTTVTMNGENMLQFNARGRLIVTDSISRAEEYQAADFTPVEIPGDTEGNMRYMKDVVVKRTMEREV